MNTNDEMISTPIPCSCYKIPKSKHILEVSKPRLLATACKASCAQRQGNLEGDWITWVLQLAWVGGVGSHWKKMVTRGMT